MIVELEPDCPGCRKMVSNSGDFDKQVERVTKVLSGQTGTARQRPERRLNRTWVDYRAAWRNFKTQNLGDSSVKIFLRAIGHLEQIEA